MLRVLLFVEPKPLPDHLFRNLYWLEFPLRMFRRLQEDAPGHFEFHAAVPRRYLNRLRGNSCFGSRVYSINEAAMVRRIHAAGHSLRNVWTAEFLEQTEPLLAQQLDKVVGNSLPDIDWDLVLTFGETCRYSFAEQAMKLNVETSSFSRPPFKHSFFMDHLGLFREAAPARYFSTDEQGPRGVEVPVPLVSEQATSHTQAVRQSAQQTIASNQRLPFKKTFDRYLLLPLQASNYSSFDAQCDYGSQLDYLFDVCDQVDPDVGLVVTEHPNVNSIEFENRFELALAGLKSMFPNVVYLPRAKYFPSASFSLIDQVQGVWTVASNVGPVARFLGKPVGCPQDSHIAYAADVHQVSELVDADPSISRSTKPVFDWLFDRYVIPTEKIDEPGWLASYFEQRIQCFKQHGRSPESFPPLQASVDQFVETPEPAPVKSFHYKSLIQNKIELFRLQSRNRLTHLRPRQGKQSVVLVNDTAELEEFRHLGCNHVMAAINTQLARQQFRVLGRINGPADLVEAYEAADWLLINGEGSFHHNSIRARQLLDIALEFKLRETRLALVNSIWEANDEELAEPLREFDVVAVRDQTSAKALRQVGVEAMVTPDFSLGQWSPLHETDRQSRQGFMFTDNIIYERALKLFDASLHFGSTFWMMDHRQIDRLDQDGCFQAAPRRSLSPDLLTSDGQIDRSRVVITGRFHVAMACVALGNTFLYVESNTGKMTHLCRDIGLPVERLNVTQLVDDCDWEGLDERIRTVSREFESYLPQIREFRHRGLQQIENVFTALSTASTKSSV